MFDKAQTQMIKKALEDYENKETEILVGDESVKYQFTNQFRERAEEIKAKASRNAKISLRKGVLIAAVIAVLAISTVAMLADQSGHIIRIGDDIDIPEPGEDVSIYLTPVEAGEGKLNIPAMIIEAELPIPEGYSCNYFDPLHDHRYSIKYFNKDYASIEIDVTEIYEDSQVLIQHNGEVEELMMGDRKIYHYHSKYGSRVYVLKQANYYTRIGVEDESLSDDQVIEIFKAIDEMMAAPMRSEEEIIDEMKNEPSTAVRTGWSEFRDWGEYELNFSSIEYRLLTLPEGYSMTVNAMDIETRYQKVVDRMLFGDMAIEMVDLTVDPYAKSLYEGSGTPTEALGITLYYTPIYDASDYITDSGEFVYVSEDFAVVFRCKTYKGEPLPTAEELATIAKEIEEFMMLR